MVPLSLEKVMFRNVDDHKEVAGRGAMFSRLSLAAQSQLQTRVNARGNLDGDLPLDLLPAGPFTIRAGVTDDMSFAPAGWAGGADLKKTLGSNHLTSALARHTYLRLTAFRHA
jgi:hypothetical protein